MDETHTINENLNKVQALIDAIQQLYKASNDLTFGALVYQIETLKVLSEESFESLEAIRHALSIVPKVSKE